MPNLLATGALLIWPVVTFLLFRNLPAGRALLVALIGGYLLLPPPPAALDVPLLPMTKETIPSIAAGLVALILFRPDLRILPENRLVTALIGIFVLSPILTLMTNLDQIRQHGLYLPGLGWRDMVGAIAGQCALILPFLMARTLLSRPQDMRDLLYALMIGGLVYSLPMLIEVRVSPQVNIWVYGYFQHDFGQMVRGDSYRPIVFLYHGLWVAFYAMTAAASAVAITRQANGRARLGWMMAALYLLVMLLLCRSLGPIIYAALLLPLICVGGWRLQMWTAVAMALFALLYPLAKISGVMPEEALLGLIELYSPERAFSLQFRFENEGALIQRALERPWFGWGQWGRNQIYDIDGRMTSIGDGRWVLTLGTFGFTGFIAEMALLLLPMMLCLTGLRRTDGGKGPSAIPRPVTGLGGTGLTTPDTSRKITRTEAQWIATAALLLAANLVDLIPNATLTPLTFLFSGALLGQVERLGIEPRRRTRPMNIRTVL